MAARFLFKKRKINTLGWRTFIFSLLAILLLFIAEKSFFSPIRQAFSNIIQPLYFIIDFPSYSAQSLSHYMVMQKKLVKENQLLQDQLFALKSRFESLTSNKEHMDPLNQAWVSKGSFIRARVLALGNSPALSEVIINKGKGEAFIGQAVLDPKGVVGQIIQVDHLTSRIILITHKQSGIPVKIKRTGFLSILVGDGNRSTLSLLYVPSLIDIQKGDELVTSGLGGGFLPELPVAKITSIQIVKESSFLTVKALPIADLNSLTTVYLFNPRSLK